MVLIRGVSGLSRRVLRLDLAHLEIAVLVQELETGVTPVLN
jgi:hypothetical protein